MENRVFLRTAKLILVLLICALPTRAQNWSTFLDPSRAIDWSSAGFVIPAYSVNCATQPSLTAGSGAAAANSTAIQAALNSCDVTHNVVNIPAGTWFVTSVRYGTQGKQVLRGAGPNSTTLTFTTGTGCAGGLTTALCMIDSNARYNGSGEVLPPSGTQQCLWTAGYAQGTTSITLSSCGGTPPVNQTIILDQANDVTDNGGVFICDVNIANCGYESATGGNNDGRSIGGKTHSQQQVTLITGVVSLGGGSFTVTISPGVYFTNISSGQAPGAWWPGFVKNDGVESLTVDTSNAVFASGSAIGMYDCYQCWVKNVRSIDAGRNHVDLYQSANDVIRDSYFYQSQSHSAQSYVIEQSESSGYLVENNIFQQVTAPIISGQGSGGVIGYNFSIGNIYTGATNWMNPSYSSHNAGNEMNLFEGNNFNGLSGDDAWGASDQETYFRNMLIGWQATLVQNTVPVVLRALARNFNIVGNVIGQPGYHTQYQTNATSTSGGTGGANVFVSLYDIGWAGIATCSTGFKTTCDPLTFSTLMRWGNYDVFNLGIRWDSTEASPPAVPFVNANFTSGYFSTLAHTLPASLYYNSRPSWWPVAKPFPPIGPDVVTGNVGTCNGGTYSQSQATIAGQCLGGSLNSISSTSTGWASHVISIPAQDCYLSIMNGPPDGTGSVLAFDATTCYSLSTLTPPTNLHVVPLNKPGN